MSSEKMEFNTQAIMGYNTQIKALKSEIDGYLSGLNTGLSTLSSAVRSGHGRIVNNINDIHLLINEINGKISTNVEELSIWLDTQMKGYDQITTDATLMLRKALEFINDNFPKVPASSTL